MAGRAPRCCSTARTSWPTTSPRSRRLADALEARGLAPELLYAASLKDPEATGFVAGRLAATRPAVVLNATFFSARRDAGSPLDEAGAPVLQPCLQAVPMTEGDAVPRAFVSILNSTELALRLY